MASTSLHKVSSSDHPFFREALRCVNLFVTVARSYAALVFAGAMDLLLGPFPIPGFQGKPIEHHGYGDEKQHAGALGLITASVMGLLMAMLVRRCCKRHPNGASIDINWHDLFKYTHMGRTATAAMMAVLTWRGFQSVKDYGVTEREMGRIPMIITASAFLSLVAAASFHYLHFRLKKIHAQYCKIKQAVSKKWK